MNWVKPQTIRIDDLCYESPQETGCDGLSVKDLLYNIINWNTDTAPKPSAQPHVAPIQPVQPLPTTSP